jgi:hypothetical protein
MLEHVFDAGGTEVPSAMAYLLAPGIAVVLSVLAFNLMGTAFDEVLDPKLRKREESGSESRLSTGGVASPPAGRDGQAALTPSDASAGGLA